MKRVQSIWIIMLAQWLLLSLLAFSLIFTNPETRFPGQRPVSLAAILAGLTVMTLAIWEYRRVNKGKTVKVLPTPQEKAQLVTSGIYSLVRHPIYLGTLIIGIGIAIGYANITTTIIVALMIILLQFKSRFEESLLMERYPGYLSYRKTTGRILPRLFRSRGAADN